MTKTKLIQLMMIQEALLLEVRSEYSKNELNDLEFCLQSKYYDLEPIYLEVMRTMAKPVIRTYQSKVNNVMNVL